MVRERVKNREFTDLNLLSLPEGDALPPESCFPIPRPLEIDLGCGRGRFLLAHARLHPQVNFLGIDRSLIRLKKIDRRAAAAGLANVRLIHGEAATILPRLPAGAVTAYYVFFPDPWPKRRHHPRRLVSPGFIDLVFQTLRPGGIINLCTDHPDYFSAIMTAWKVDRRFAPVAPYVPSDDEETDFGMLFRAQNLPVNRCSFRKSETSNIDAGAAVDYCKDIAGEPLPPPGSIL